MNWSAHSDPMNSDGFGSGRNAVPSDRQAEFLLRSRRPSQRKNTDPEDVMFFSEAVLPSISDHLTVSQNISFSPNRQISQENTLDQRQKCKIKRQRDF